MSKICAVVIANSTIIDKASIKNELRRIASQYGKGIWFYEKYEEPFVKHFSKCFVISFSDSTVYDNCEMLLLPDGCSFNGKINNNSFCERMKVIEEATKCLNALGYNSEIFIGESGTDYEEFSEIKCSSDNISDIIYKNYTDSYGVRENDLHIILSK